MGESQGIVTLSELKDMLAGVQSLVVGMADTLDDVYALLYQALGVRIEDIEGKRAHTSALIQEAVDRIQETLRNLREGKPLPEPKKRTRRGTPTGDTREANTKKRGEQARRQGVARADHNMPRKNQRRWRNAWLLGWDEEDAKIRMREAT